MNPLAFSSKTLRNLCRLHMGVLSSNQVVYFPLFITLSNPCLFGKFVVSVSHTENGGTRLLNIEKLDEISFNLTFCKSWLGRICSMLKWFGSFTPFLWLANKSIRYFFVNRPLILPVPRRSD